MPQGWHQDTLPQPLSHSPVETQDAALVQARCEGRGFSEGKTGSALVEPMAEEDEETCRQAVE